MKKRKEGCKRENNGMIKGRNKRKKIIYMEKEEERRTWEEWNEEQESCGREGMKWGTWCLWKGSYEKRGWKWKEEN